MLNDFPPLSAFRQKKLCLNLGGTSFRKAANFTKRIHTTRSKVPFLKSFFFFKDGFCGGILFLEARNTGFYFQHHQKIKIKKSEVLKPGDTFLLKCYTLKDNG